MKHLTLLILTIFALSSCSDKKNISTKIQTTDIPLSYAKGFTISKNDNITKLVVNNPWKPGEILDTYYLVKNDSIATPSDGEKIKIPLNSIMVNSATYLGFIGALNELDKVVGVCNADYIYNPFILQEVKVGNIADLGESFNLDIENLLCLKPEAVMTTSYNTEDINSKKMKQCGLPIIYNVEWQEPSILGRTEWIKFIACFFDKSEMADSIFNDVEQKYNEAKQIANGAQNRPTIFSGQDYRGTWSLSGGKSYTAQLFKDAKASYLYENDNTATSIASNIEQVLIRFNETDIWVGTQEKSLHALEQSNSKYRLFKAFKEGKVYNYEKRVNGTSGNDYWEGAVVRPDLLLKDMIKVCHPELLEDYELTYMQQLSKE